MQPNPDLYRGFDLGQHNEATARAQQYRKRAQDMRQMAEQAKSPNAKAEFLSLADKYELLAREIGRRSIASHGLDRTPSLSTVRGKPTRA